MNRVLSEAVGLCEKALPLIFLPKALQPYKHVTAANILRRYIDTPETFWRGAALRHAEKVKLATRNLMAGQQCGSEELVEKIMKMAHTSFLDCDRPIFVMGAGGSGSTWLGAMVGDVPGYSYGREIYIPFSIKTLFLRRSDQQIKLAVSAIMILHAWGLHHPGSDYRHNFVNSGRSVYDYPMFKKIWPRGTYLCLVRDPRDLLMSVTHRKANYRAAKSPTYNDRQYLQSNARSIRRLYKRIDKIDDGDINFIKYEKLKSDVLGTLSHISDVHRERWDPSVLSNIVFSHSAENMRAGIVKKAGNLDEGGQSASWHESMSREDRELVCPYIQNILEKYGYENDSNWIDRSLTVTC